MDAANNRGTALKKREATHRMVEMPTAPSRIIAGELDNSLATADLLVAAEISILWSSRSWPARTRGNF